MAIEQITIHQELQGQKIQNTFLVGKEAVSNASDVAGAIETIVSAYEVLLAPIFHPAWSLRVVTRRNVSTDGMPILIHGTYAIIGEDPGEPMANTVAGIVHFRSVTTRPNRSTKFLAGFGAGRLDVTGRFDSVALGAMADWAEALLEIATIYPDAPLLVGRFYPTTSEIQIGNQVDHYVVTAIPGTRKSRRIGVGS